jgi:hypothetical protein
VLHNGGFYGKSPQKSSTTVSQLLWLQLLSAASLDCIFCELLVYT